MTLGRSLLSWDAQTKTCDAPCLRGRRVFDSPPAGLYVRPAMRLGIVGVGLMGGAVGLRAKKKGLAREIVGVFRRESSLRAALEAGAVDEGTLSIEEGVEGCELVVFATGPKSIPGLAQKAGASIARDALVTDVASVKGSLVRECTSVLRGRAPFVGSHPLAGSEKRGVRHAHEVELEGAPVVVTPLDETPAGAVRRTCEFWEALGMRVTVMDPDEHDRAIARTSHLPHLVSWALLTAAEGAREELRGRSFRDMTRVSRSDAALWAEILSENSNAVLGALKRFEEGLAAAGRAVERGEEAVVELIEQAQARALRGEKDERCAD